MFENTFNPMQAATTPMGVKGLFGLKRINWSSLLTNTQKTLNIINQAIPIVYQVKPIVNNAKTMFRVINAVKDDDTVTNNTNKEEVKENTQDTTKINDNKPVFYI